MLAGWPGQLFEAVDYQVGWGVPASHVPVRGPGGGTVLVTAQEGKPRAS